MYWLNLYVHNTCIFRLILENIGQLGIICIIMSVYNFISSYLEFESPLLIIDLQTRFL